MAEEPRKINKVLFTRPVVIVLSSGKSVHSYINEVSDNGIGILTLMPAEIGAKLTFNFTLPLDDKKYDLGLRGKIVWCRLRADKYISGVIFDEMTKADSKILKKFVLEIRHKRR